MFKSPIFVAWLALGYAVWAALFLTFNSFGFLAEHWYYPAIMVLGAFVAGLTPEGGGAVAFPMLSVFLEVDRAMARDFSLMIQSIGMTSASIFILTDRANDRRAYLPVAAMIPVCFVGFALGMEFLQGAPVFLIQALFLSLITAFAIAYVRHEERGDKTRFALRGRLEMAGMGAILLAGGACASLFGTGADILLYSLLVTRLRLREKVATHMSIMLMAAMSVLGYAWRAFVDDDLTRYQVQTWLCAVPVVLFMAPFGAFVLRQLNVEKMLRFVVALNIAQLAYFNLRNPSPEKALASVVFFFTLLAVFRAALDNRSKARAREASQISPASGLDGSA